ncbi:hypothetical protein L204_100328 [Cryptococcus depauperatus]
MGSKRPTMDSFGQLQDEKHCKVGFVDWDMSVHAPEQSQQGVRPDQEEKNENQGIDMVTRQGSSESNDAQSIAHGEGTAQHSPDESLRGGQGDDGLAVSHLELNQEEREMDENELGKTLCKPKCPIRGDIKIPAKLPYPSIPQVRVVHYKSCRDVPVEHMMDRLAPVLPAIASNTMAYRPYTSVVHPNSSIRPNSTFAVAIPEIPDGKKTQSEKEALEPDLLLIITGLNRRRTGSDQMVAVNSLVFSTQCAFWPKYTTFDSAPFGTCSPTAEFSSFADEADHKSVSGSSVASECSLQMDPVHSVKLPAPYKDKHGFLHIPVILIPLPSPKAFSIIHWHLHQPSLPLLPKLLGLPESYNTPSLVVDAISSLTVQGLMEKVALLQAVWQNLCCLGIARAETWRPLAEAWACVVGVIAGNGILLDRTEQKWMTASAAEGVAWEYIKRQRADSGQN